MVLDILILFFKWNQTASKYDSTFIGSRLNACTLLCTVQCKRSNLGVPYIYSIYNIYNRFCRKNGKKELVPVFPVYKIYTRICSRYDEFLAQSMVGCLYSSDYICGDGCTFACASNDRFCNTNLYIWPASSYILSASFTLPCIVFAFIQKVHSLYYTFLSKPDINAWCIMSNIYLGTCRYTFQTRE